MASRIAAHGWADTPLGARSGWSPQLAATVQLMLDSPQMASLAVGPERIFLYNDRAARHYGGRHPAVLGLPLGECFPHEYHAVAPFYDRVFAGESLYVPAQPLDPGESGSADIFEAYLTPVRDAAGGVIAAHMAGVAVTARLRAEEALRANEARLRALVGSGAVTVYRMSPDWRLMYELDTTGPMMPAPLPIDNWPEHYVVADDRPVVAAAIAAAIRDGTVFELEHRVRLADGSIGWVASRAVPMRGEDGAITEWFGAAQDITVRKRAEAALRETEARMTAAFESMPAGVALIDKAGRITIANAEYRRFLPSGLIPSRDPANAWRWRAWHADGQILDPTDYPGARAMRGERVVPGQDMLFTDEAGREVWTRVASVPVYDGDGRIIAQSSVIADIDALTRARDALREGEERHAFLLALSDALRPLAEVPAIVATAMRMLARHIGVRHAHYAIDGEGEAGTIADDAPGGAERTTLSIPFGKEDRRLAVLTVQAAVPRRWSAADRTLLAEVADRTWTAIERARTEQALRLSEERLRQFGEASQDLLWLRDVRTMQYIYLTPAFETIYGLTREEAMTGDTYRRWLELMVPEDRAQAAASIERVCAGEHVTFEFRIRRPCDGTIRWMRNTDFPITDDTGTVTLIGGIGHDCTEVREAELRFRSLVEGIPQMVWRAVNAGQWTWASPQWSACTMQDPVDYAGWGWLAALHPDDRAAARDAWAHAEDEGVFAVEHRIRQRCDGEYRWFKTRAAPVRDAAGLIVEWLGTSTDIHELRRLQDLQKTLLAELQHRVRNILAVTRSIVSRSDDGERDTLDYVNHLQGRISALARTQVLLTRQAGAGIDLEALIRDELSAQVASDNQFALGGPDVKLSPKAAEVLTLAVHELATNATKYGAFARAGGRLSIRWNTERRGDADWLILDWRENGVPVVDAAPRRYGFGTELVSQRIPYELNGRGSFELKPGGLASRIEFPLADGDSILRTDGMSA